MSGTEILISILGGIALLLWGCRMLRTGVMRAYGSDLMRLVGEWVGGRFRAVAIGTAVGTMLQSSTATALLVSPFVAQGAILTSGALAVMLGADLGSSLAALIFSSGISAAWPGFAFAGYVLHVAFADKSVRVKNVGRILIGLGLLLLGLRTISAAAADLSSSPVIFGVIEAAAREKFLAVLAGAFLTWVSYSSVAAVLFAVALSSVSGVSAEHLFPFVLGVNLGAALPALTSTLSEAPATRRIPLGNFVFRFIGVAIVFVAFEPASRLVEGLTTSDPGRIIAFHVAFNAALIPAFVFLTGPIGRSLTSWLPDLAPNGRSPSPRYLDLSLLHTPAAALGAAARETLRMGEIIEEMLVRTREVFDTSNPAVIREVEAGEAQLDALNDAIKLYLTRLMREELNDEDSRRAVDIITYTTNLEHVGDIIDRNLMELAAKKQRLQVEFSEQGRAEIHRMHASVMETLSLSLNVFMTGRPESARTLLERKSELRGLELEGTEHHLGRLRAGKFESMATSSIHLDVIRDFRRINSHLVSVAYPVLEHTGAAQRPQPR